MKVFYCHFDYHFLPPIFIFSYSYFYVFIIHFSFSLFIFIFLFSIMKALLGDALSTLTEQMGIDMKSELMSNPQSMKDVQVCSAVMCLQIFIVRVVFFMTSCYYMIIILYIMSLCCYVVLFLCFIFYVIDDRVRTFLLTLNTSIFN